MNKNKQSKRRQHLDTLRISELAKIRKHNEKERIHFQEGIDLVDGDEHLYDSEIFDDMDFWRSEVYRLESENRYIVKRIKLLTKSS